MKRYIRLTSELNESTVQALDKVEAQYLSLSDQAKTEEWVGQILDLFHKAVEMHPKEFIQKVFFEFHHTTSKIREQQARISLDIGYLGTLTGHNKQVKLVSVYRAIVSKVFDPYISVIVACLQFKEGSFD